VSDFDALDFIERDLMQVAKYGPPSFFVTLTRRGDIPPGL
jgi:hypothetical protein